jgi:FMNH2-dependent dimethyl sulfone monooxygenase
VVRETEEAARREVARITDVSATSPGYHNYHDWLVNTQLDQRVSLEDYSVSNRGLRAELVGTPAQVIERIADLKAAGVDLLLIQCSPQLEEMERIAETVIQPMRGSARVGTSPSRASAA